MKFSLLPLIAAGLFILAIAHASPGPSSQNSGLSIHFDLASQYNIIEFWAAESDFYFIQTSDNLIDWQFLPAFIPGTNAIAQAGYRSTEPRKFFRLAHTDDVDSELMQSDFDGDGLTVHQEFLLGSDPFNPDTSGDGIFDGIAAKLGTPLTPPEITNPDPADVTPPSISLHHPHDAEPLP